MFPRVAPQDAKQQKASQETVAKKTVAQETTVTRPARATAKATPKR